MDEREERTREQILQSQFLIFRPLSPGEGSLMWNLKAPQWQLPLYSCILRFLYGEKVGVGVGVVGVLIAMAGLLWRMRAGVVVAWPWSGLLTDWCDETGCSLSSTGRCGWRRSDKH